ncbi:hypothetical protein ILUMI_15227, partial [Ignelater luminosus]
KTYNSKEKSKYLLYLDVNNLYGHAQRQSLPFENFRWLGQQEIDSLDVSKVSDDSVKGYILEVDLHYPQSIHDNHQDLPLAPERLKPPNSKYPKLLTTLYDKEKYKTDIFDTRDFDHNNPYGIPLVNKKKIGNLKDECAGQILTDYVGLKPKRYALKIEGEDRVRKSKGIKRCIVKTITFEDYVDVLQNQPETPFEKTQNYIRSKKHCVSSREQSKLALSYKDDKRYVLSNQIDTLPYGHYRINM